MSSNENFPVVLMQDRYSGVYSGGAWLAVADADELVDGDVTRAQFCLSEGPFGDDVTAGLFWASAPDWIASGDSPEAALAALRAKIANLKDPNFKPPAPAERRLRNSLP